jgi:hypothetical protein
LEYKIGLDLCGLAIVDSATRYDHSKIDRNTATMKIRDRESRERQTISSHMRIEIGGFA